MLTIFAAALLLSIAILVKLSLLTYKLHFYWKRKGIPARGALPFFGSYYPFIFRKLTFPDFQNYLYTVGPDSKYVGMMEFHTPAVLLKDPELVKQIGIKNFEDCPDHKPVVAEVADSFFGKMLYFVTGSRWKEINAIMRPAFTCSKVRFMFELVSEVATDFVDYLLDHPEETSSIEMKDALTRFTADAIATTAFGIRVECMKNKKNAFHTFGRRATDLGSYSVLAKILFYRACPRLARWLGVSLITDKTAKFFKNLIKENLENRKNLNIARPDVIHMLMQTSKQSGGMKLSIDDIISQAFNSFFAGFDTSSTLMCYTVYELAVNQEIQKRLQNEVDQCLVNGNGVISYESLNDMKYLDAVVAEALRKYPPLPISDRICRKAFQLDPAISGAEPFTVEPGMYIFFPIYGLHRDPKYFPNPEKFDPERFSKENKPMITPGTYIPFGIGPRICLGDRLGLMQAKLIIAHLLAKFEIKTTEKTRVPLKFCRNSPTMGIDGGLWLELRRRESC